MRVVTVYRSERRPGTYIYVDAADDFARVPADLAKHFGQPVYAMELELTADFNLVQASAAQVLSEIHDNGFYLQLPPAVDPEMGRDTPAGDGRVP